jgi:hypothetical protein
MSRNSSALGQDPALFDGQTRGLAVTLHFDAAAHQVTHLPALRPSFRAFGLIVWAGAQVALVPAEDGADEQACERAEQRGVVSQPSAKWVRQREPPLPERDGVSTCVSDGVPNRSGFLRPTDLATLCRGMFHRVFRCFEC